VVKYFYLEKIAGDERMDRFNRHFISAEEHKRLQERINELEAENEKLKGKNDIIKELINLMGNNSWFKSNGIRQESNGTLEQVVELAKDLSNDIRNIMKNITPK
jgi:chromosome segregation ATPase